MREIKFRAWHKDIKKMYKIGQITLEKGIWNYEPEDRDFIGMSKPYQPSFILMQYTGLKDKNGKEIYEGDKITYTQEVTEYEGNSKPYSYLDLFEGVVVYANGSFWVNDRPLYELLEFEEEVDIEQIKNIEVIGNIYENPELLEGEN